MGIIVLNFLHLLPSMASSLFSCQICSLSTQLFSRSVSTSYTLHLTKHVSFTQSFSSHQLVTTCDSICHFNTTHESNHSHLSWNPPQSFFTGHVIHDNIQTITKIINVLLTVRFHIQITSTAFTALWKKYKCTLGVEATGKPFSASVFASSFETIKSFLTALKRAKSSSWVNFSCSKFCFHVFSSSSMLDLFYTSRTRSRLQNLCHEDVP